MLLFYQLVHQLSSYSVNFLLLCSVILELDPGNLSAVSDGTVFVKDLITYFRNLQTWGTDRDLAFTGSLPKLPQ